MKKGNLFYLILFYFVFIACEDQITNNYFTEDGKLVVVKDTININDLEDVAKEVSNNITEVLSYEQLKEIEPGTKMKLRINRKNFSVWEIEVVFDETFESNGERLILCHSPMYFPIGAGDSGSPLITEDNKVVGSLCYGYFGNSNNFIARAIEDVINIKNTSTKNTTHSSLYLPIEPAFHISGISKEAIERYPSFKEFGSINLNNNLSKYGKTNLSKEANAPIIPGSSISINYITGDFVNAGATGTISYVNDNDVYAFGHSFIPYFKAAPTYTAEMKSFITTISQSFKMAQPTNEFIGSFTLDHRDGILISRNVEAQLYPIKTTCSLNGNQIFSFNHQVAKSKTFSFEKYLAIDISMYLIWSQLVSPQQIEDAKAECNLEAQINEQNIERSFTVTSEFAIDWEIYRHIREEILSEYNEGNFNKFNLSVNIIPGKFTN